MTPRAAASATLLRVVGRRVGGRGTGSPADETGAWEEALRLLGRKPRSASEVERHLLGRGFGEGLAAATLLRLRQAGYVDDRALAREFLARRSERLGHAPTRLIAELVARGVARELAEEAWRAAAVEGDLDDDARLHREIERRLRAPGAPAEPRRVRRVYNALIRAGYDEDQVRAALEPFLDALGTAEESDP